MKTSSLIHALAIFLLLTATASADSLISFLGQPNNGAHPITQSSMVATDFRTGSVSTTVSQITVSARQSGPPTSESSMLDVLIIADNNGRPGDFLNTPSYYVGGFGSAIVVPGNTTTFTQFTRNATSGITLAPNTTYWLVFYVYSGPGLHIASTASQTADPGGVYSPVASTAMKWGGMFVNWTDVPGANTPIYRLQGTVTPPPSLISFIGQANGGSPGLAGYTATDFRTGGSATTVTELTVAMRNGSPNAGSWRVSIAPDNGGEPGWSFLGTFPDITLPINTPAGTNFTVTSASGITLAPNTTYWLVFLPLLYTDGTSGYDTTGGQTPNAGGLFAAVATTAMKHAPISSWTWTNFPVNVTPLYELRGTIASAPEITVEQPAGSGLTDHAGLLDFGGLLVGQDVTRVFTVRNTGTATLSGIAVTLDGDHAGTDFQMTAAPAASLAAGASTTFSITFSPDALGMRTAAIHIASNDSNENPFDIAITGEGLTASQSWRQTWFGSTSNTGDAAPNADPNKNGIPNLMEYALGGDPAGSTTGTEVLPDVGINTAEHCMEFSLTRYLDRNDITLTVQAADSLSGPWTDLARSVNGAAFSVLATGASVTETGSGSTRAVTVCDIYPATDPAHPRRFMHLVVSQ